MSTIAETATTLRRIGPGDHGRHMTLEEFAAGDFEDGFLYELNRGVVEVAEVPAPNHGRIVHRVARMFIHYEDEHPGIINYMAGGGECRLRFPGFVSDRHPDQAIYLDPQPPGRAPGRAGFRTSSSRLSARVAKSETMCSSARSISPPASANTGSSTPCSESSGS